MGLTLWKAIRNVRTWAEVEPEARRRYFRPLNEDAREVLACARHEAPELEAPLSAFALLVQAPDVIEAEQLAEACERATPFTSGRMSAG